MRILCSFKGVRLGLILVWNTILVNLSGYWHKLTMHYDLKALGLEPPLQNAGVCYVSNRFVFLCITTFRRGGEEERSSERGNGLFDQSTVFAESALACFLKRKTPSALKPNTIPASFQSAFGRVGRSDVGRIYLNWRFAAVAAAEREREAGRK